MTLLTLAQNQAWGFGPAPMLVLQRYQYRLSATYCPQ
jgi:hypothetical protein